jgi:hypothetical protein
MKTWFTHWKKGRGLDIEAELKASRPTPSSHFVKSIAAHVNPRPVTSVPTRSRFALATAVIGTGVLVAAVGASGAFSSAASGLHSAARSVAQSVHLDSAPLPLPGNHSVGAGGGNGGQTSAAAQYLGAPTITKVSVSVGKVGTSVTVTGTDLGGITGVTVATLSVTSFSNPSTTSLMFQVPATSSAVVGPVTVTNPAGTATSAGNFTVEVAPANPVSLSDDTAIEPGQVITITGSGFTGVNLTGGSVKFNNKAATYTVTDDGHISATVPAGVTAGTVKVTNLAGFGLSESYTVAPGPAITSFLPASSGVGGATLQINGSGFTPGTPGTDTVKVNGVTATNTGTWTATKAFVIIPTSPAINTQGFASGPVTVTDAVGTATSSKSFTTVVAPTISSISPTTAAPGAPVTITGQHFTGTSSVKFSSAHNGATASYTVLSDTSIRAIVPSAAITGPITVANAAGNVGSPAFTQSPPPTITNIGQSATPAVPGTTVTLSGTAFDTVGTVTITFGGGVTATATVTTVTSLHVAVPSGAKTGPVTLTETLGSAKSKGTVSVAPAPTISAFPANQEANGSFTIVIHGTNLLGTDNGVSTTVTFFGSAVNESPTAGPSFTKTAMTVIVPSDAQIGRISVTTNAGSGLSKGSFTPIKPPSPTSLWPSQGQKVGGTLTISGSQLSGAKLVTWLSGGVKKTAVPKVISDGVITVTVPANAASGTLRITNSVGETGDITGFTLLLAPTISTASASGGVLTITGHNFVNTDDLSVTVKVGTAACTSVAITNSGQTITCNVPGSATGHKLTVTVTEEAGTAKATNVQF